MGNTVYSKIIKCPYNHTITSSPNTNPCSCCGNKISDHACSMNCFHICAKCYELLTFYTKDNKFTDKDKICFYKSCNKLQSLCSYCLEPTNHYHNVITCRHRNTIACMTPDYFIGLKKIKHLIPKVIFVEEANSRIC